MGGSDGRRQRERDVRLFLTGPPPPPTMGDVAVFVGALATGVWRALRIRHPS